MMGRAMGYVLLSLIWLAAESAMAFDHQHQAWTDVLKSYTSPAGFVNYAKLKKDSGQPGHKYTAYLKGLEAVPEADFSKWSPPQKKAFLMNAYNAFTVKLILDHYPVGSIKEIGGLFKKPWDVKFFSLLGGKIRTLDPIEHKWLRPVYKDYRIHAAVNCASISCPPLRREAFRPELLDKQLDEQMSLWLKDASRNKIAGKKLLLSKIFDWYEDDFVNWGGGVKAVLVKHWPEQAAALKAANDKDIDYLDYDWKLNDVKNEHRGSL